MGFNHKNDHFISWGIPGNSHSWYVWPKFEINGEPPIITFFEKFQNRVLLWAYKNSDFFKLSKKIKTNEMMGKTHQILSLFYIFLDSEHIFDL